MNYELIPLQSIPWQSFSVVLNGQNCVISIRQMAERLYADLICNGVEIFTGRLCTLGTNLNCYPTPNFVGSLFFLDTFGKSDPQFEGLGDRWKLIFSFADDESTETENGEINE